jgi:hypothetical protein
VCEDEWLIYSFCRYIVHSTALYSGTTHDIYVLPCCGVGYVLDPHSNLPTSTQHIHLEFLSPRCTPFNPILYSPLSGPLVRDNKTQPPPLPKLVAWVVKLAAFEFRYDGRPLVLGRGREGEKLPRGEVGLVVPSREPR